MTIAKPVKAGFHSNRKENTNPKMPQTIHPTPIPDIHSA